MTKYPTDMDIVLFLCSPAYCSINSEEIHRIIVSAHKKQHLFLIIFLTYKFHKPTLFSPFAVLSEKENTACHIYENVV